MLYRLLADVIVLAHIGFVVYVLLGGLLVARWPRTAWVHLPAVAWGIGTEWTGTVCPLTPLENLLRQRGGEAGYAGGFIEHYVLPLLYPAGLTPHDQVVLGLLALGVNLGAYGWVFYRHRPRR